MKRALWVLIFLAVQPYFGQLTGRSAYAWFDETHIAVAKVAGYAKYFNACGPDMIKEKMADREGHNQQLNNPGGRRSPRFMAQAEKFNLRDDHGYTRVAKMVSVRDYIGGRRKRT